MRNWLLALVGVILMSIGACTYFLPERFAVNAPFWGTIFGADAPEPSEFARRVIVPEGFSIAIYADGIRNARFLRLTATGDLLVSTPRTGQIWLLARDRDGDGRPDAKRVVLADLDRPHGMDFRDGWLYVGEGAAIRRARFDAAAGAVTGALETVVSGYPEGGNHWTRTIRFGPDGWLYLGIGSSCNVCVEDDPRRAAIVRYRPDGSGEQLFATGLRNAVGFDWRPGEEALYATDNGRDLLGDDFPPCELDRVVEGGFYGWPFANGENVPDPDLGARAPEKVAAAIPPVHPFGAHTAPLGIAFYRGTAFPPAYRGAAFVALHGSWNRTRKSGYKVVVLQFDAGAIRESDFAVGFEENEDVIGRPVDVLEGPDGELFVSDDYAGAIYRVTFRGGE
jgi:glucose/arabinose dehydrogenase